MDIWVSLHLLTTRGLFSHVLQIDCIFLSICSQDCFSLELLHKVRGLKHKTSRTPQGRESLCQCSWLHKHMFVMSNHPVLCSVFHVLCPRLTRAESQPPLIDKPTGLPAWARGNVGTFCQTFHVHCWKHMLSGKTHRSRLSDKSCLMATQTSGSCILHFLSLGNSLKTWPTACQSVQTSLLS